MSAGRPDGRVGRAGIGFGLFHCWGMRDPVEGLGESACCTWCGSSFRARSRHRGNGVDPRPGPEGDNRGGVRGGAARVPPVVGGGTSRHAGSGQLRAGGSDRALGQCHHHPAGRLGGRHAAQSRPTRGSRTVRRPSRPCTRDVSISGSGVLRARTRSRCRAFGELADMQADTFPDDVVELINYLLPGDGPPGHPSANPGRRSSPRGVAPGLVAVQRATGGILGLPFSFADHFAPKLLDAALSTYRSNFRPSVLHSEPRAMVAVSVLCAAERDRSHLAVGLDRAQHPAAADGPPGPAAVAGGGGAVLLHRSGEVDRRRGDVDTSDR